jgi:hypothetical protein
LQPARQMSASQQTPADSGSSLPTNPRRPFHFLFETDDDDDDDDNDSRHRGFIYAGEGRFYVVDDSDSEEVDEEELDEDESGMFSLSWTLVPALVTA